MEKRSDTPGHGSQRPWNVLESAWKWKKKGSSQKVLECLKLQGKKQHSASETMVGAAGYKSRKTF